MASVAAEFRLSERQVRNIWNERTSLPSTEPPLDARQAVQDEIDFLDALLTECVERADITENESVWQGTVKTRLEIRRQRRELLGLYGRIPRGYDDLALQRRLTELIETITEILTRHRVPDVVFRELEDLRQADDEAARETHTPRLLK